MIGALLATRRGAAPLVESAPYAMPTAAPYNAPAFMPSVVTSDGSDQTVHPSLIDFGQPWNGHRFWLVHTPYPGYSDRHENPEILVSDDCYTWEVPAGLTNPLYPSPPIPDYNNDTDWTLDPASDELVLIFRTPPEAYAPVVVRSADGITWPGSPQKIDWTPLAEWGLSPCIQRDLDGTWHMWQVGEQTRTVWHWTATAPEGPWGSATACTGIPSTIWHMTVQRAPTVGYHMLLQAPKFGGLLAAASLDGLAWVVNPTPVLQIGSGGWDHEALYRSALALDPASREFYRVVYAGEVLDVWRLGYTHIPVSEWPDLL